MKSPEKLDLIGRVTARSHSYLKRHPRLRTRAISIFGAADRLIDRLGRRPDTPLTGEIDPHRWVETWNGSGRPSAAIRDVLAAEEWQTTPPIGTHVEIDDEYLQLASISIPQPYVLEVPGGHVLNEHGAVATPDGVIIDRASKPVASIVANLMGYKEGLLSPDALQSDWERRPKKLSEAAVLSTFVGRGYFHWLFDVLPRLHLLDLAGWSLDSIARFVIPSYFARYQIETLAMYGIGRDRIVSSFQHRHILADRLIVPAHPRETGMIPRWVCDYLRETFKPIRPVGVDPMERIYIIRKATDHGLLDNEARLQERLGGLGFVPLAMEDYSLEEKAWILQHAKVVIGPSGGGLANIVFCNPGTVVVELRVQPYPVMEAWDIGNRMGLRFYDVLPDGYRRSESQDATTTGVVSEDVVISTLELAGI